MNRTIQDLSTRAATWAAVLLAGWSLTVASCTGGGPGGGGNDNVSSNANRNTNDNAPANENENAAENENENDNLVENQNDNAAENENENTAGNVNENVADNQNANDNAAPQGLPPENQRSAFQSQCAQNVITCTTTFPVPVIGTGFLPGQVVTTTATGFRVQGADGDGSELVQLIGSGSAAGQGATQVFFSWSAGAGDPNPCTLAPGMEFSTEADPQIRLQAGFHYIRLTVGNDLLPIDSLDSDGCGTFENYVRRDFEEIEVEIVD